MSSNICHVYVQQVEEVMAPIKIFCHYEHLYFLDQFIADLCFVMYTTTEKKG